MKELVRRGRVDGIPLWQLGMLTHAYADCESHVDDDGSAYGPELGHALDRHEPDYISTRPGRYQAYCRGLCEALGGNMGNEDEILHVPVGESEKQSRRRLRQLTRSRGLPQPPFRPSDTGVARGGTTPYPWPTLPEVLGFLQETDAKLKRCESGFAKP